MRRSKRVLCILLILVMVIGSCSLSIMTSALDVDYFSEYWQGSVYKTFSDGQNYSYIKNGAGSYTTIPFSAGSISAAASLYSDIESGYVYTFRQKITLQALSPINNQELTAKMLRELMPTFVIGLKQDFDSTSNYQPTQSFHDQYSSAFDDGVGDNFFKYSVILSNPRLSGTTKCTFNVDCVVEIEDPLYFQNKYFGFGFSVPYGTDQDRSEFSRLFEGGVILSNLSISSTAVIDDSTFYQANVDALNDIKSQVATSGAATVNAITSDGAQTRESIDDLKDQMHEDAVQAHQDAVQAHQDAQNAPQHEYDFGQSVTPDPDDLDIPNPDLEEPKSFFNDLLTSVSTTEKLDSITLPSVTIPFLGIDLFDDGTGEPFTIDFSEWLENEKIELLVGWTNGIFCIGAIVAILWKIIKLIETALGLRSAESPDTTGSADTSDSNSDTYTYTYHSDGGWYS